MFDASRPQSPGRLPEPVTPRNGRSIKLTAIVTAADNLQAISIYWHGSGGDLTRDLWLTEWNPADYPRDGAGYALDQTELPEAMLAQAATFDHVAAATFCGSVEHAAFDRP